MMKYEPRFRRPTCRGCCSLISVGIFSFDRVLDILDLALLDLALDLVFEVWS